MIGNKESNLYDPLLEWLEDKYGYSIGNDYTTAGKEVWYKNRGPSQKCCLDVIGVKNIGAHEKVLSDEIEIIGVEVKDKDRITYKDLTQAAGYKIFVHKAYFATTARITTEDKHWARVLGIGLIKIGGRAKPSFLVVVEAPLSVPNHAEMLRLLDTLLIGQCTLCNCYFYLIDRVDDESFHTYIPLTRLKWINLFPSETRSDLKKLFTEPKDVDEEYRISRYICQTCVALFKMKI